MQTACERGILLHEHTILNVIIWHNFSFPCCLPTTNLLPPLPPPPPPLFLLQILFVHINTGDDDSDRVSSFFNIEDDDTPTARIINLDEDMKKFVPDFEGLDAEKIKTWVTSYLSGDLKVQ